MLKNLLSALFVLLFYGAHAQFNDAKTKSLTLGINGLPFINSSVGHGSTLMFRYFPKEDLGYRFLLNLNMASTVQTTDDGKGIKTTFTKTSNFYGLGFGCQKTLARFDKFNVYAAADLVGFYNYNNNIQHSDFYKTSTGFSIGDFQETVQRGPINYSIGLFPTLGVNYFFTKNFSLGVEYGLSAIYMQPSKQTSTFKERKFGVDQDPVVTDLGSISTFNISSNNTMLLAVSVYF